MYIYYKNVKVTVWHRDLCSSCKRIVAFLSQTQSVVGLPIVRRRRRETRYYKLYYIKLRYTILHRVYTLIGEEYNI